MIIIYLRIILRHSYNNCINHTILQVENLRQTCDQSYDNLRTNLKNFVNWAQWAWLSVVRPDLYKPDARLTVGVPVRVDGPCEQCKYQHNEESDEDDSGNVSITRPCSRPQWEPGSLGLHEGRVLTLVGWNNILHSTTQHSNTVTTNQIYIRC